MDFYDQYSNVRLFTYLASLPNCLIFWAGPKIMHMQIRHSFPAWCQAMPDIRQASQPDKSCSGKRRKFVRNLVSGNWWTWLVSSLYIIFALIGLSPLRLGKILQASLALTSRLKLTQDLSELDLLEPRDSNLREDTTEILLSIVKAT